MIRILSFLGIFLGVLMANTSIKTIQINNVQIPVIYEKSKIIPTGSIKLIFQGGGVINNTIDDDKTTKNKAKPGLASLRNALLREGTKTLGGTNFAKALEQKAISLDIASGNETLIFALNYLKEEQSTAIKLLGDLLKEPNFTQDSLKKAKTSIISRILASQNDFDYLASELLDSRLFLETPLAQKRLGTKEQIQSYTLKDVESSFAQALTLNHLIIVAGGDIEINDTLKELKEILQILPEGKPYQRKQFSAQPKGTLTEQIAQTDQAYIYFGSPFKVKNLEQESYLAKVASFILGSGGFGSRLLEEVRVKRGLAYSAYMTFNTQSLMPHTIGHLQTKLESKDKAIKVVKKVISDFIENGATQKELDSAKSFLLGSEPLRNETLSQRLNAKFRYFYNGLDLDFNTTQLKQIENLTLEELNKYIKSHTEILDLTFGIITAESKNSAMQ